MPSDLIRGRSGQVLTARRLSQRRPVEALSAQALFAQELKTTVGPALRDMGLKGSAGHYLLPDSLFWAQVGFQKNRSSAAAIVAFTVNISVISKTAWEAYRSTAAERNWSLPRIPSSNSSWKGLGLSERLGRLMPENDDLWWGINTEESAKAAGQDVVAAILKFGLPAIRARLKE